MTAMLIQSGEISPNTLYTLDEVKRRTGLGTHALRAARRRGLPVRYLGGRGYIVGRDLIEHVLDHGKNSK